MVQCKTTSQKGEDGKGSVDNVGDRKGTNRSLAAASALNSKSTLKQMSQGNGGMKASPRRGDQATEIIGPTDDINREGRKAAEPSTQSGRRILEMLGITINQGGGIVEERELDWQPTISILELLIKEAH
jgi:hypothetical protein